MFGARSPRALLVALSLVVASVAAGAGVAPSVATAASPHQAAVIVDTGGAVQKVVITFSEDSISGIDALQRAGANPVVYAMGPGAAVCRLYGVGRDSGPNCLGGADGDNRYWAYFRAPAGTSSFKYSSIGGGVSRVHDGDVEGWKFGTGTAPPFASLASLLPPPPPPPTSPPATSPPATNPQNANPGIPAAHRGRPRRERFRVDRPRRARRAPRRRSRSPAPRRPQLRRRRRPTRTRRSSPAPAR